MFSCYNIHVFAFYFSLLFLLSVVPRGLHTALGDISIGFNKVANDAIDVVLDSTTGERPARGIVDDWIVYKCFFLHIFRIQLIHP